MVHRRLPANIVPPPQAGEAYGAKGHEGALMEEGEGEAAWRYHFLVCKAICRSVRSYSKII
jgi:hypothetical protein